MNQFLIQVIPLQRYVALACLTVGCAHQRQYVSPRTITAPVSQAAPTTRDERWQADLRYFAAELPARHANMYRYTTREAFARGVAELDSAIPSLTDMQIRLRFLRLTAMVRDEHTGAIALPQPAVRLPIETLWMDDGPYIVAASAPFTALLGQRIVGIDDHPMEAVADTLRMYIPHESEVGFRRQAERGIVATEALHDLGLAMDTTRVTLEVETRSSARSRVELPAVAWSAYTPAPPPGGEPPYRRRLDEKYWFAFLPESRTMFIKYNECRDSADFRRMMDSVALVLDSGHVARVVVDLRNNGGGDDRVINPLIEALRARPAINRPNTLYAIIGRETASSGLSAANDLRAKTHATILGEPAGPNGFGDKHSFRLPYSKLKVEYATKDFHSGNDPAPTLYPDVNVPPTPESIVAGRDPVMEWILARR